MALTHSGCPTRAGAAGRRAGRRPGWQQCRRRPRCGRTGTCPPPACTSAPRGAQGRAGTLSAAPSPWAAQAWAASSHAGGRGRLWYLLLFSGQCPVCFGYERLQRRDVVVAQVNLGQGQEVRGGRGSGAATPRGQRPTLLLWSQGTESGTSVCLQETTYLLQEKGEFPCWWDTDHPRRCPSASIPLLPPPCHTPLAFSAHRSRRIFFLALASLYLLSPSWHMG